MNMVKKIKGQHIISLQNSYVHLRKHIISLFLLSIIVTGSSYGQNLHFSQFMNAPYLTNPANTGFIPYGDYRLGVNYRSQWSNILSMPYKTMGAFGDMKMFNQEENYGWLGVGGSVLHDVAGSGNLTSTKIYGSVAYHQKMGLGSLLSLGFNAGWVNKHINVSNLKFPDQFDGNFFNSHLPSSAQLDYSKINYLDMQVGMNYAYYPNENVYLNAGIATHHVNRPRESFFQPQAGINNRIAMRHNAFINGSFKLSDMVIINPNSYISIQSKATEWLVGANVHYNIAGMGENVLIAGLYTRNADAIIPMIGIGLKDYVATFTYDATMSTLKNFNQTRGAFEVSIIKHGVFDQYNGNRKETMCPTFK